AAAVPPPGPVFVRPADAERQVDVARHQRFQWTVEQLAPAEPVVVVAEAVDAVLAGKRRLPSLHFHEAQVVVPELGGKDGLLMPAKSRPPLRDIRPLGEALPPPTIVF